jgi:ornithine decarboxylase
VINKTLLKKLAKEHGTPLFVIDHDQLRKNLAEFNRTMR